MQVWQLLKRKQGEVITTRPDATVKQVVDEMNKHHIGALMVLDDQREILGIVTERDVMRRCLMTTRADLTMPASEVMTSNLIVAAEDDTVQYVMGIMTKNRIRHLPIVKDGDLIGIISIGDVVESQLDEAEYENRLLVDYIRNSG